MPVLPTRVDPRSEAYRVNHAAMLEQVHLLEEQLALARAGGGEKYVRRHRERGKLLPRERIELLLDRDAPFLATRVGRTGIRCRGSSRRPAS